jgi:hypothetical protein
MPASPSRLSVLRVAAAICLLLAAAGPAAAQVAAPGEPAPDSPAAYPYVREEVKRLREQVQRQERELKRQVETVRALGRAAGEIEPLRRDLSATRLRLREIRNLLWPACAAALLLAMLALVLALRRPRGAGAEGGPAASGPVEDRLRSVEARFRALDRERPGGPV